MANRNMIMETCGRAARVAMHGTGRMEKQKTKGGGEFPGAMAGPDASRTGNLRVATKSANHSGHKREGERECEKRELEPLRLSRFT